MLIGGAERDAESGDTLDVLNPSTGTVIARVPAGNRFDVDAAVGAAKRAFEHWSQVPARQRAKLLLRLADLIDDRLPELFVLETANNGRPIIETRAQLTMCSE